MKSDICDSHIQNTHTYRQIFIVIEPEKKSPIFFSFWLAPEFLWNKNKIPNSFVVSLWCCLAGWCCFEKLWILYILFYRFSFVLFVCCCWQCDIVFLVFLVFCCCCLAGFIIQSNPIRQSHTQSQTIIIGSRWLIWIWKTAVVAVAKCFACFDWFSFDIDRFSRQITSDNYIMVETNNQKKQKTKKIGGTSIIFF